MTTYLFWPANTVITVAGDDILWGFQVRDKAGEAVNITGWTFGFWAVDQRDATNTIIVADASFTIIDPTNGLAELAIARTSTLDQGGIVFRGSIWRLDSGSNKEVAAGTWKVMRTARP